MSKEIGKHQDSNKTEEVRKIIERLRELEECEFFYWDSALSGLARDILKDAKEEDYKYLTSQDIESLKNVLYAGEAINMLYNGKSWNEVASAIEEWHKDKTPEEKEECNQALCLNILSSTDHFLGTLFVDAIYGNNIAEDVRKEYECVKADQKQILEGFGERNDLINGWSVASYVLLARKAKNEGRINDIPEEIEKLKEIYTQIKGVILTGRLSSPDWQDVNPFVSQWYHNRFWALKADENKHDTCLDVLGCAEPFFATLFADAAYGESMPEDIKNAYDTRKEEERQILNGKQRKDFWINTLNVVPVLCFAEALKNEWCIKTLPSEVETLKRLYEEKMESYGDFLTEEPVTPELDDKSDWIRAIKCSIGEIGNGRETCAFCTIEELWSFETAGNIIKALELMPDEDEGIIVSTLCGEYSMKLRDNVFRIMDSYWNISDSLGELIYPTHPNVEEESPKKRAIVDNHNRKPEQQ